MEVERGHKVKYSVLSKKWSVVTKCNTQYCHGSGAWSQSEILSTVKEVERGHEVKYSVLSKKWSVVTK